MSHVATTSACGAARFMQRGRGPYPELPTPHRPPAQEVRARLEGVGQMLTAADHSFDPTLPGVFASDPPAECVPLSEAMAADGGRFA